MVKTTASIRIPVAKKLRTNFIKHELQLYSNKLADYTSFLRATSNAVLLMFLLLLLLLKVF